MSYRPSIIKSLQRGTITCTNGAAGTTATFSTAVTTANTVLKWVGARASVSGSNDARSWNARLELTNTTTVTAYSTNTATVVSYEVVEFYPNVVRSIQRGTFSLSGSHPVDTTITAVTTAKTQVDILGIETSVSDAVSHVFPTVQLTSTTNLRATVGSNIASTTTVGYQVVEFR